MTIDPTLLTRLRSNDPTLTSLDLSYQNLTITDIGELVTALSQNTHLTELDLTGNSVGDEGAILLSQNTTLLSLTVLGAHIGKKGARALAQHPTLRVLDISQNTIGNSGAIAFAKNTVLTTLKMAGNQINHEGANAFVYNNSLNFLDLSENQLNDLGAKALAKNKSLSTLIVAANQINDNGAIDLAQHPTITKLVLHHNNITSMAVDVLATNTQLTSLDLNYNVLGIEGAGMIAKSLSLTSLFLVGNNINNIGIKKLANNQMLKVLNLSYNQITDIGIRDFEKNQWLQKLNLSHNQLTIISAKFLNHHPTLRVLCVSYNLLGDDGAMVLAQSDTLTELDLTGNQIGPAGAQALAKNSRLKKLVLSYNLVGDDGAIALAHNETLSELWMSYNHISDEGAIALAQNQTLKLLNVNFNHIQDKGREALAQNKYFQSLFISLEQPPEFTSQNLNSIFALTQDLLCIRGINDKIQFFNPTFSRVLGYKDDELLDKHLRDFLHPDDRLEEAKHFFEDQQKFPILQRTYRYRRKDGAYRMIQWSSQMRNQRIYASGIDMTERAQLANKLLRTEHQSTIAAFQVAQAAIYSEKQSDFIAHLCHEIRNPLSGITGSLDVVKARFATLLTSLRPELNLLSPAVMNDTVEELDKIQECLDDMTICAQHEETILNDNLDVAKMAEGKLRLANVSFDLKNAVYEVSRMLKGQADSKGLVLNTIIPQEAFKVKGDPLRVKQIMVNLVSNAIKFTAKGQIELALYVLETTHYHTRFELRVSDTGIGLTEDEISRLFERFSQAVATMGNHYSGSGLGLVIAKNLACLMGGDITIESKKGQGTIFHCTIQCDNLLEQEQIEEEDKAALAQMLPQPAQPTRKLTILVVDDNAINRKALGFFLSKAGHTCLFANDGHEAVMQYSQHAVDIILMDIVMPCLDGISATRQIRQLEQEKGSPPIPIIALTGNALEAQRQEALNAGMNEYITKPYKKEEIFQKIAAFFVTAEIPPSMLHDQIGSSEKPAISQQTFWRPPTTEALPLTPPRVWMDELLRTVLYPLLDRLSTELYSLNVQIAMPKSRFQQKSSRTGWQLYTITGKDEHWAVLNFIHPTQANKLLEAIQQSGAQVRTKKMKSGTLLAVAIVFSSDINLSNEIDKIIPSVRGSFSLGAGQLPK